MNMFEKNDKALFTTRVLLIVVCLIIGIGGVIAGALLCYHLYDGYIIGLPLIFGLPILASLVWIFGRLFLNFLCDIKLIRNKLYEEDIESFKPFLEYKTRRDDEEEQEEQPQAEAATLQATPTTANTADITQQLLQLKKLLDDSVITQEEFDVEKAKILKNM